MARLEISTDTTGAEVVLADFERLCRNIHRRHGEAFRALERDLDAFCAGDGEGFGVTQLEAPADGDRLELVATPPAKLTELLRRARELGVI